jgi:hypothetical protein
MPTPNDRDNDETQPPQPRTGPKDGLMREDQPIPRASDDEVLEETARLAREGKRDLEQDDREPAIRPDDSSEDSPSR